MSIKHEQAEKTRTDLLEAALVVFSKKGYTATRLEDIACQAGVTRGAFYWHFRNKSDVFIELHKDVVNNFIDAMKNTYDKTSTPVKNLKQILYQSISGIIADENSKRYGKLFFRDENAPELRDELEKLRRKTEKDVYTFFYDIIEQGKDSNEIRTDISTKQIYISAIVTLKGSMIQIFNSPSSVSEADVQTIIDIYSDGIKKQQ